MKKGLLAGSFDPPTLGHINIIERAAILFDELIIAIATNSTKIRTSMFTTSEKENLLKTLFKDHKNIKIKSFDSLIVDLAKKEKVTCLIRGIRSSNDLDYELKIASANKKMSSLETLFLIADPNVSQISSSLVREIAMLHGPINHFVPEIVAKKIQGK